MRTSSTKKSTMGSHDVPPRENFIVHEPSSQQKTMVNASRKKRRKKMNFALWVGFMVLFIIWNIRLTVLSPFAFDQIFSSESPPFPTDEQSSPTIAKVGELLSSTNRTAVSTSITEETSIKDELIVTIKDDMMARFESLPPPQWPQVDDRTAVAMVSGEIIGVDNMTSFDFNHTIVTAYYEFFSKHTAEHYKAAMIRLFPASEPMVIFVEPNSTWYDFISESRQHAPTLMVPMKFDELVMSTTFTKEFWDYEHSIDDEIDHRNSDVYKIWNEKLIFVKNTIQLNPFRTNGFAWMDVGYFQRKHSGPKLGKPIILLDYNAAGVPKEKVLLLHVRDDPPESDARVNIAGNGFFGTAKAFLALYTKYYETFWDWIHVKNKLIGSDQFVMTETCMRYADVCYPYFPGWYKDWFAMGNLLMKHPKYKLKGVSPEYVFLDQPPASISKVPTGHRISYCNGTGVVLVDEKEC